MHCKACDASIAKPDFNSELNDWELCGTCLQVVMEILEGWQDKPYADEDDLFSQELLTLDEIKHLSYEMSEDF